MSFCVSHFDTSGSLEPYSSDFIFATTALRSPDDSSFWLWAPDTSRPACKEVPARLWVPLVGWFPLTFP